MGAGLVIHNPDAAMDCFIKREFEGIDKLVNEGASHNPLFIPETFLYPGNLTETVIEFFVNAFLLDSKESCTNAFSPKRHFLK